jgi:cobalamin biosynthesis Mg chelatase CobN
MTPNEQSYPVRPPPSIDPTALTTEALQREISGLSDTMHREIAALRELVEAKIIGQSRICEERFGKIDKRFHLIEQQRLEQKQDTKAEVASALFAQKEAATEQNRSNTLAISKSEAATADTISKLADQFRTTTDAIGSKIDDLKERVGKIESVKQGAVEQRTEGRAITGSTVGIVGVVITVILFVTGLLGYSISRRPATPAAPPQVVTVTTPSNP